MTSQSNTKTREILPPKGLTQLNLQELWQFRDLLYIFIWRDIKVRYKQTVIGVGWAIIQPLITMIIFSLFFGRLMNVPSQGIPYPVFVYAGLLLWNYFFTALTDISNSLVGNENMIKKVYFPRIILPIAQATTPAVDFVFAFIVLLGLMWYYQYIPHWQGILILPILLLLTLIISLGAGFFLAALNARYRDVRYILPFFTQLLLFVTPVIYPLEIIPERFQALAMLNPMAGIITVSRSLLLGLPLPNWPQLLGISAIIAIPVFVIGIAYFRRTERFFADEL
ncbi:ABC transporter permease [Patescibacteria group bacterium]|nr:ABC transporter permease [Patescibacteria group bacterium]